jgi:hypothetical protein
MNMIPPVAPGAVNTGLQYFTTMKPRKSWHWKPGLLRKVSETRKYKPKFCPSANFIWQKTITKNISCASAGS